MTLSERAPERMNARRMAAKRRRIRFRAVAARATFFETTTEALGGLMARALKLPKRKRPERTARAFTPRAPRRSCFESILDRKALPALATTADENSPAGRGARTDEESVRRLTLPAFRLIGPFHTQVTHSLLTRVAVFRKIAPIAPQV